MSKLYKCKDAFDRVILSQEEDIDPELLKTFCLIDKDPLVVEHALLNPTAKEDWVTKGLSRCSELDTEVFWDKRNKNLKKNIYKNKIVLFLKKTYPVRLFRKFLLALKVTYEGKKIRKSIEIYHEEKLVMTDTKFKIRFTGGFGDCLRMISLQSSMLEHHKKHKIKIYWVYSDQNLVNFVYDKLQGSTFENNWIYVRDYDIIDYNNGVSAIDYGYPTHQTLYDFLKLFDFFELISQEQFATLQVPELSNWRCHKYPSYDMTKQLNNLYKDERLGLDIILSKDEEYELDNLLQGNSFTFCIQLSGRDKRKKYSDKNNLELLNLILKNYPQSKIFLIDQPKSKPNQKLLFDNRIIDLVGKLSIRQLSKLIQEVDYLISPDSYAKYLRNWVNKPQTILYADVSHNTITEGDISNFIVLENCFNTVNLLTNNKVKILGTNYKVIESKLLVENFVQSIDDISPQEIINSISIVKLVTVTCKRDLNQMILQSHSIDKFVTVRCEHHVFIEDDAMTLEEWQDILSPFYKKHRLVLHKTNVPLNSTGWFRQQVTKIEAVKFIDDDYLVLDSKNFFIKHTDLHYDIPEGTWYLNFNNWTDEFINFLSSEYKCKTSKYFYTQQTPFKIRKEVALKILHSINMCEIFDKCAEKKIWPSEFVLYSIYSDYTIDPKNWDRFSEKSIYHTWWWNNQLDESQFDTIYNSSVEILGLHKNVWYHKNEKIKLLANWLCSKGLLQDYVYPATINMDWGDTYLYDENKSTNLQSS